MGYGVHLRRDRPITEAEWTGAVGTVDNVRLAQTKVLTVTNPVTGESISRDVGPFEAEAYVDGEWYLAFRYREGEAVTDATRGFDNHEDPLRTVMRGLAAALGARIVGAEGETYD